MEGFKASSSSNGSKEGKDKQGLKRSSSGSDLQRNIDRFQHDELYNLKKPRIEDNPKSIDQATSQSIQEIEKAIEQRAQAIMDKDFGNITDLLADFEKQGVRLLDPGASSSAADTPLPSQKHSEEIALDVIPDESVETLHKTHTATFDPVFQAVFKQACRENQSEGDALLQASAEAHQLAYKRAFLKAKELVLQQELQKVKRESQKLDQYIQEQCQAAMFSEIEKNLSGDVQKISQLPVVKEYSKGKPMNKESLDDLILRLESNRSMYYEAISKIDEISQNYAYNSIKESTQSSGYSYFHSLLFKAMHKEYIYTRLSEQILNTTESYKDKYGLEYKKENLPEYFSTNTDQRAKLRETINNVISEFRRQNIKILPVTIVDIFKEGIKTELNKIKQENTSHR